MKPREGGPCEEESASLSLSLSLERLPQVCHKMIVSISKYCPVSTSKYCSVRLPEVRSRRVINRIVSYRKFATK